MECKIYTEILGVQLAFLKCHIVIFLKKKILQLTKLLLNLFKFITYIPNNKAMFNNVMGISKRSRHLQYCKTTGLSSTFFMNTLTFKTLGCIRQELRFSGGKKIFTEREKEKRDTCFNVFFILFFIRNKLSQKYKVTGLRPQDPRYLPHRSLIRQLQQVHLVYLG